MISIVYLSELNESIALFRTRMGSNDDEHKTSFVDSGSGWLSTELVTDSMTKARLATPAPSRLLDNDLDKLATFNLVVT